MGLLLVVLFLVVPVLEIYVIVQVGQLIGALPTVILLLAESLFGAWLVRREGSRAWRTLRSALTSGQLPSRELADAALVLVGGTLLLTPGFVTDVVGFFVVLPLTRPLARRLLAAFVARRATLVVGRIGPLGRPGAPRPGASARRTSSSDRVVPGEVVRDETTPDSADHDTDKPDSDNPDSEGPGRVTGG